MSEKQKVVIIGAGFGGLKVARSLAFKSVDVLLIDRNNYHTFTPLLYQVATCGLDPSSVAYPIRSIFTNVPNVNFLLGQVDAIDTSTNTVVVTTNAGSLSSVIYDYLVVAGGSKVNYFGNQAIKEHSFALQELNDAVKLRNHILRLFEKAAWTSEDTERNALMTFVVVGGGPTGLETAGALYELYNNVLDAEYDKNDNMHAHVILLEASDSVLGSFPEPLRKSARKQLETIGVDVRTEAFVEDVGVDYVALQDGTVINTHTVVWSAGVQGNTLAEMLNIKLERGNRIPVNSSMQVIGSDNVLAVGDIAYLLQPDSLVPYPGLIPVAQQQGKLVADNILKHLSGEQLNTFSYFDRGIMATIGRRRAVAWAFNRIPVTGFFAWIAWLGLHLLVLMGMRNRAQVFLNWVWNYVFYDRSVQIILEGDLEHEPYPEIKELSKIIQLY
ncbi:MAG: NAD(P)/FAD-dependent oxidoreductase [Chloroflexota bacterium]